MPAPISHAVSVFNLYALMSPAIVGVVIVCAVVARGVAFFSKRRKDRKERRPV